MTVAERVRICALSQSASALSVHIFALLKLVSALCVYLSALSKPIHALSARLSAQSWIASETLRVIMTVVERLRICALSKSASAL